MRHFRLILFIVALMSFSQLTAQFGQSRRSRDKQKWEFSLAAGASLIGDESFVNAVEGGGTNRVDLAFDTAPSLSFRVTDNFSRHVGAELEYVFANGDVTFFNLSPAVPALDSRHRVHSVTYSAVIYPGDRLGKVRPFGVLGAGASYFQLNSIQDDVALANGIDLKNRWTFAYTFGGGVKFMLGERWGLRVDLRNQSSNVPDYGLRREAELMNGLAGPAFRPEGAYRIWHFGAGFTYVFPDN